MDFQRWLAAASGGVGGALLVAVAALVWNAATNGGVVRALGGITAPEPAVGSPHPAVGSGPPRWQARAATDGYDPACDYRWHLLVSPDQQAKSSFNLSRYAGDAAFIYPTIVNRRFLQGLILAPGRSIVVEISDDSGAECPPGQASLDNLPRLCFETKIEQRC